MLCSYLLLVCAQCSLLDPSIGTYSAFGRDARPATNAVSMLTADLVYTDQHLPIDLSADTEHGCA